MGKTVTAIAVAIAILASSVVFAQNAETGLKRLEKAQEKQCRETPASHPFRGLICGKKFRHTPPRDMAPPERTREEGLGTQIYRESLGEAP